MKSRNVFLIVQKAGKVRSGCQCGQGLVRALFQFAEAIFSLYPHAVESRGGSQAHE